MSREKQIEEMAKIIGDNTEQDTMWGEIYDCANALYNAGYRKASEVVLEVIGEINDSFDQMVNEVEKYNMNAIQEGNLTAARIARYGKDVIIPARNTLTKMLEKKYTEGEG